MSEELKLYSEMDYMRFFEEFSRGVDEMKKEAKKFKRKKIEFNRDDIENAKPILEIKSENIIKA